VDGFARCKQALWTESRESLLQVLAWYWSGLSRVVWRSGRFRALAAGGDEEL